MSQIAKYFAKIFRNRNNFAKYSKPFNLKCSSDARHNQAVKEKYNFHVKMKRNIDFCICLQEATEAAVRRYSLN